MFSMEMRIVYIAAFGNSFLVIDVAFKVVFKVAFDAEFNVAFISFTSATPLHSSLPKVTNKTTGRKEKGELKMTSLTNDQNVSQENHLNETSPVSLLSLYGLSPRQYMNM